MLFSNERGRQRGTQTPITMLMLLYVDTIFLINLDIVMNGQMQIDGDSVSVELYVTNSDTSAIMS